MNDRPNTVNRQYWWKSKRIYSINSYTRLG